MSILREEDVADYNFLEVVDGYEDSLYQMKEYEKKYNLSSFDFYNIYKAKSLNEEITYSEADDWAFEIECFLLCDGKLQEEESNKEETYDFKYDDFSSKNNAFTTEKTSEEKYKMVPRQPSYINLIRFTKNLLNLKSDVRIKKISFHTW